jgi:hypothetical protein
VLRNCVEPSRLSTLLHEYMNFIQGVVSEYLRADRAMFVTTECCIQLCPRTSKSPTNQHCFCAAVAVNLRDEEVFLCEVTYSKTFGALDKRLISWASNWNALRSALAQDFGLPQAWPVRPWLFVPPDLRMSLEAKLLNIPNVGTDPGQMPFPRITDLEEVAQWKYKSWNGYDCAPG